MLSDEPSPVGSFSEEQFAQSTEPKVPLDKLKISTLNQGSIIIDESPSYSESECEAEPDAAYSRSNTIPIQQRRRPRFATDHNIPLEMSQNVT
jgi:hypothetical protein